jgi:hypothetical protein
MSGTVISILDRTDFDYSNIDSSKGTGEIPIAQNIDISQWDELTLLVRLHATGMNQTGAKFEIIARSVLPSPEDPAAYFRDDTTLGTVAINQGDAAPQLFRGPLGANAGAMMSVFLVATQGTNAGNLSATLSIAVSMKA